MWQTGSILLLFYQFLDAPKSFWSCSATELSTDQVPDFDKILKATKLHVDCMSITIILATLRSPNTVFSTVTVALNDLELFIIYSRKVAQHLYFPPISMHLFLISLHLLRNPYSTDLVSCSCRTINPRKSIVFLLSLINKKTYKGCPIYYSLYPRKLSTVDHQLQFHVTQVFFHLYDLLFHYNQEIIRLNNKLAQSANPV